MKVFSTIAVVFLAKEGLAESLFYNTPMLSLGPSAAIRQDLTPYGYYPIVPQYYGFNGRTSYHPTTTTTIHRLRRDAESDSAFTYSVMAHHPSNDGMVDNRYNAFRMDDRMVKGLTSRMDNLNMDNLNMGRTNLNMMDNMNMGRTNLNMMNMQDRQRQMMDGRLQHGYQMDNMNMDNMKMDNMNMGRTNLNMMSMQDRQRQMMDGRMQQGYQIDNINMNNLNMMNMDNMNMDRMNNMDRINNGRMKMDNMNMGRTNVDRTNLNMMNMDRMTNMDNMSRMNMGHQMNRFKREADSDVVRYSTMTETPFQRSQTSVYYEDSPKILMQTSRPMYLTNGYTMPYVTRPSMITRPVIMTYY